MKNRQVDLLIVVNMFLAGFDATTLNTLFVDKNLKQHGLIQAYSRTNRILNSVKTFGNIVCFRNLQQETARFVENAFRDGAIRTTGTDIDKILPAMSRFRGGNRQEKKKTVIEKLKGLFEKYFGVI